MKSIIGLVVYDTDTGIRVHRRTNGLTPPTRVEVLYRGPATGAWFLHIRGTPFDPASGEEGESGGQSIQALTLAEAVQWGDAFMPPAKFASTFGASLTPA